MASKSRLFSVDVLRGVIMVIMALDHTRDFFNASAMAFQPEDLTRTTYALFFTRWITHFCAPVFMFTAGIGACLRLARGGTRAELSRFLWTRGLWLLLLEVTAVRFTMFFNVRYDLSFLLVFWSIGMSMIVLAGLIYLPVRLVLAVSVAMIGLHNFADRLTPEQLHIAPWLFNILHRPGLVLASPTVIVGYPLIPWIGIIGVGFCFGRLYRLPSETRQRVMIQLGLAMTIAFIALRWSSVYGDPSPWMSQPREGFTLLSFLRVTKNPPSLLFVLMTLGPAITVLGLIDRIQPKVTHPFVVFGRTPLFYFLAHFALIHTLAIAMAIIRYGVHPWVWTPPPTLGGSGYPDGYGWSLPFTYLMWAVVVGAMYPMCRWLASYKSTQRRWWLSYL